MELNHRPSHFLVFKNIHERLQKIQARSRQAKSDPQKIKTVRGLVLVFLSIVFGWLSMVATESSGVAKYRMNTWPKVSIWKKSLQEQGLSLKNNLGDFGRQLQTHPDAFSGESVIWVSIDGCMIYLPASPYHDRSSELWACENDPKQPRSWIKAGSGMDGFEKLMDFFEKIPKKTPLAQKQRLNIVDPKEIRY